MVNQMDQSERTVVRMMLEMYYRQYTTVHNHILIGANPDEDKREAICNGVYIVSTVTRGRSHLSGKECVHWRVKTTHFDNNDSTDYVTEFIFNCLITFKNVVVMRDEEGYYLIW